MGKSEEKLLFFRKKFCSLKQICTFALPKEILVVGLVVQLVRMPPCHGGGRGFESRPDRKEPLEVNLSRASAFR